MITTKRTTAARIKIQGKNTLALPEILITVGIVAIELMAYLYFVKRYPVLPAVGQAKHA